MKREHGSNVEDDELSEDGYIRDCSCNSSPRFRVLLFFGLKLSNIIIDNHSSD